MRQKDFPIRLNSAMTVTLHWLIVLLLAPIGKYQPVVAVLALGVYVTLLSIVFAGRPGKRTREK